MPIALALALTALMVGPWSPPSRAYTASDPITIVGDAGFVGSSAVVGGTGTPGNPYIIEGWDIHTTGGAGIVIQDTKASFVIRNVRVVGAHPNAIYLYDVTNSRIFNSVVEGGGVHVEWAKNVSVRRTSVSDAPDAWGIYVGLSVNVTLYSDRVQGAGPGGILVQESQGVNITSSEVLDSPRGIFLYSSKGITAMDNTLTNATTVGMGLASTTGSLMYHNNFMANATTAWDGSPGANRWDAGYPTGGNFWSNDPGVDLLGGPAQDQATGPDGILDTPHALDTGVDHYPLARPSDVAPVASFTQSAGEGNTTTPFAMDASRSSDREDLFPLLRFRWDWEGDGRWDTPWSSNATPTHVYPRPGSYTPTLEVRDTLGQTATAQGHVVVHAIPLSLTVGSGRSSGVAPLDVALWARGIGGVPPYAYAWTLGDGGTAGGPNISYRFQAVGSYTVHATVTDSQGLTAEATLVVVARGPMAVVATADRAQAEAPTLVTFRAVALDGQGPYNYTWEFGDGGRSSLQNPYHTYVNPGTYRVVVTVQGGDGSTANRTLEVVVAGPRSLAFAAPPTTPVVAMALLVGLLVGLMVGRHLAPRRRP